MIIGVSGKLRAGKDTTAYRLIDKYGFSRVAFADALKYEVGGRLRRTLKAHLSATKRGVMSDVEWAKLIYDYLWINRDDFSRALLQEYGTEVRRADDQDYWVKQWGRLVETKTLENPRARFVVPDTRFENEAKAIRERGGLLIRVDRPVIPPELLKGVDLTHASETSLNGWTDWDAVLVNDQTIPDLWMKVDELAVKWEIQMEGETK